MGEHSEELCSGPELHCFPLCSCYSDSCSLSHLSQSSPPVQAGTFRTQLGALGDLVGFRRILLLVTVTELFMQMLCFLLSLPFLTVGNTCALEA